MPSAKGPIAAAVLALLVATCASAAVAGTSRPPLGYQLMCLQTPSECKGDGRGTIVADAETMSLLKGINTRVNRTIRPRMDAGPDVWSVDVSVGDCEDFALTKRRQLIQAGLPASALRMAYVKTRSGEGHAVLIVVTTRGQLVLDNLTGRIRPLSQSGLRLVTMSSADPLKWT